jgi:glycosyltransferase involved in cell wall biosynthesis
LIVTVGQQTRGLKEPSAIILAMEHVDGILEVIGDGDFHEDLVAMANANPAIRDRVRFRKYMPNEEVMKRLYEADIVAYRTYYAEFSKIMMESMLAGAPIVASRLSHSPVAELESNTTVCLVGDTPELWAAAFNELLGDHRKRRALGESALALARRQYNPESLEKAHADLYRRLMGTAA